MGQYNQDPASALASTLTWIRFWIQQWNAKLKFKRTVPLSSIFSRLPSFAIIYYLCLN
jgi:hypothetical protein